jgi:signal peptidase I
MRIVKIAAIVAFLTAGLVVTSAFLQAIIVLPLAAIPLAAGIGILRKRVWSAWGYALFQFGQLLLVPVVLLRSPGGTQSNLTIIGTAAFGVLVAVLFLLAGRSMNRAGWSRGLASPWIAITALATVPFLFVQPFVTPTGAMENTLLIGDHILVRRLPRPTPARGMMVAFWYPVNRQEVFVKRVIGVPGDRIRISNKTVYLNGSPLNEPYAVHKTDYVDSYRDNFPSEQNIRLDARALEMLDKHVVNGELVVPDGSYFVLGDNRDSSLDSRYWGFITADDVIGRPFLIYDSQDRSTEDVNSGKRSGPRRVRWNRILKRLPSSD